MFHKSNTVKQTYVPDLWLTLTVHDQHKAKTVTVSVTFYHRGITVGVAPPHGET